MLPVSDKQLRPYLLVLLVQSSGILYFKRTAFTTRLHWQTEHIIGNICERQFVPDPLETCCQVLLFNMRAWLYEGCVYNWSRENERKTL